MGCFQFLKVMMIFFNGIIFIGGATVLGVGIWVKVDGNSFMKIAASAAPQLGQLVNVGYLCIAIGVFLCFMGFLGGCGAIKENKCLLLLFFCIILVIFIAELAGAVVVLAFSAMSDMFVRYIWEWAEKSIRKDYNHNPDITKMWDAAMTELKCCGVYNYTEFQNSTYFNGTYPGPCCTTKQPCGDKDIDRNLPGCFAMLIDFLKRNSSILGAVALGISGLELLTMVVTMTLYCHIGKDQG